MIDKVVDGVYLSGASSVLTESGRQTMKELKISHVLTVSAMPIPPANHVPGITYEFVYAMDTPTQDLLGTDVISRGVASIYNAASKGGGILVHCEVGVSRSVTVVAAYLMKRFQWTESKALAHIQIARPIAHPNDGFYAQLRIYRKIGYRTDRDALSSSVDYRTWCVESGNAPESGKDPRAGVFVKSLEPSTNGKVDKGEASGDVEIKDRGNKFRCRKCREPLFYAVHLMTHEREGRGATGGERCPFGYLVEPLTWMNTNEYQGKIGCPKCGDKLGNFCWGGRQCAGETGKPCSRQVQPWVHLHKTKVDEVRTVRVAVNGVVADEGLPLPPAPSREAVPAP